MFATDRGISLIQNLGNGLTQPLPILIKIQFCLIERDNLIKKGLVYSGERGVVSFTVPHFGKYLRNSA